MYHLPDKFRTELYKEFNFDREFTDETALFHKWESGRILCSPLPPFRNGVMELYVNKALKSAAELITLVLPCDTSTEWFHKVWNEGDSRCNASVEIRFIKGRLRYEGGENGDSRFKHRVPTCVVVIRN